MRLFNRNKIVDERIDNQTNGYYKTAYMIAITISFISMLYKIFFIEYNINLIITELILICTSLLYISIRTTLSGIYAAQTELHDTNNKITYDIKVIIMGIIAGLALSLYFGIRSAVIYGNELNRFKYFFLSFAGAIMIYLPLFMLLLVLQHKVLYRISVSTTHCEDDEV